MSDAYAAAGVDQGAAEQGVGALVAALRAIEPGRPRRALELPGHYASVLRLTDDLGLALSTDGVGSKLVLAEQLGRYDTVGIDCVAMNVNDVICVGAEPIAMLDYLAVERVDDDVLAAIGRGLAAGATAAGIEIPGGELAVLPELIRGHPSPHGFDLCGTCVGTVPLDRVITGAAIRPGDTLIGLPSSGLHSNGYTLARKALLEDAGVPLAEVGEALLEPTVVYVRAVLELLRSGLPVHGLAHITGGGVQNLTRLGDRLGFAVEDPLPVPAIIARAVDAAGLGHEEAYDVFNMGCGFVAVVPGDVAARACALLAARHPGTRPIGVVTGDAGRVTVARP